MLGAEVVYINFNQLNLSFIQVLGVFQGLFGLDAVIEDSETLNL